MLRVCIGAALSCACVHPHDAAPRIEGLVEYDPATPTHHTRFSTDRSPANFGRTAGVARARHIARLTGRTDGAWIDNGRVR